MTAEEKAKELFATYRALLSLPNAPLGEDKDKVAKECAIAAVDEVLDSMSDVMPHPPFEQYWTEVKNILTTL